MDREKNTAGLSFPVREPNPIYTKLFCRVCGNQPNHERHFGGGRLCNGKPELLTYRLANLTDKDIEARAERLYGSLLQLERENIRLGLVAPLAPLAAHSRDLIRKALAEVRGETFWRDLEKEAPTENERLKNGLSLSCIVFFTGDYGTSLFTACFDVKARNWRVTDPSGTPTDKCIHNGNRQTFWCYAKDYPTPYAPTEAAE